MTMTGRTTATIAEQPTGTAQHIEYADVDDSPCDVTLGQQQEADTYQQGYVGPWPLRRRSISSWSVLSDKSDATRSSIPEYTGKSAAMNNATNPFFAGFSLEDPFSDKFRSEASSSTMTAGVGSVFAVADSQPLSEKSELTRTLEQADRQHQAVLRMLNGEASSSCNDEGSNHGFKRDEGERPADDSTSSERERHPVAQALEIPPEQQRSGDVEREAAATTLNQLQAEECGACKEKASVMLAGKCMLGLTAGILWASPYVMYYFFSEEYNQATAMVKEKQRTFLLLSLLAIPVTSALSLVFLAWVSLNSFGPIRRRLNGGFEYFKLWLCFTFGTVGVYFLIAALTYKYAK